LLLIAYLFDLTAARTKIPSVILLLLGWMSREVTFFLISTFQILPLLYQYWARLDLFLSLEGSLELELNRSKVGLIKKSSGAFLPLVILAFRLLIYYLRRIFFRDSLINAIPFV
jgi:hypothetical protein